MAIDVSTLDQVAHVDHLLSQNQREINRLNFELTRTNRAEEVSDERDESRQAGITTAQSRVDALAAQLGLLAEGTPEHNTKSLELVAAQANLAVLQDRAVHAGTVAEIQRQLSEALLTASLTVVQTYQTSLEDRKSELVGP